MATTTNDDSMEIFWYMCVKLAQVSILFLKMFADSMLSVIF